MKAIAAMSRQRVIGLGGKIPWHLPEELRWFKRATANGVLLMGRKTYESIGRPLPGRLNLVATRGEFAGRDSPDVATVRDLDAFRPQDYAPREVWVIGGAEIFARLLGRCEELYLSDVSSDAGGDTFFPPFERDFRRAETVLKTADFEVFRYVNLRFQN